MFYSEANLCVLLFSLTLGGTSPAAPLQSETILSPEAQDEAIKKVRQSFAVPPEEEFEFSVVSFEGGIAVLYGRSAAYWLSGGSLYAVSPTAHELSPGLPTEDLDRVHLAAIREAVRISVEPTSLLPPKEERTVEIRGRITDSTYSVLPGVAVQVYRRSRSRDTVQYSPVVETKTDSKGEYAFGNLENGEYLLRAELAGFVRSEIFGSFYAQHVVDLVLRLGILGDPSAPTKLEIRVIDAQGVGVGDATVLLQRVGVPGEWTMGRTDAQGQLVEHLWGTEYIVQVFAPGYSTTVGLAALRGERDQAQTFVLTRHRR